MNDTSVPVTTDTDNGRLPEKGGQLALPDDQTPLTPNYEGAFRALLVDHRQLLDDRAAFAQRAARDRKEVQRSQALLYATARENATWRRNYPDSRWIALERVNAIIDETWHERPISPQALHKWCACKKVRAELRGGRWYLERRSFIAHWNARGLPAFDLPFGTDRLPDVEEPNG